MRVLYISPDNREVQLEPISEAEALWQLQQPNRLLGTFTFVSNDADIVADATSAGFQRLASAQTGLWPRSRP
jgi:hypothetical protein